MCGRFVVAQSRYDIAEQFGVDEVVAEEYPPRFNIAPIQMVFAVASSRDGETRRLGTFRWGLVPRWAKDPSIGARLNNARAETVTTKPSFRDAIARRRCIIPASGYYEWKQVPGEDGKVRKVPFYFRRNDDKMLAFAGLWEVWRDAEGGALRTCAVITTTPNAAVAKVHDRMPVILERQAWDPWLVPGPLDGLELGQLFEAPQEELLLIDQVSDRVNNARNDDADLIVRASASPEVSPSI